MSFIVSEKSQDCGRKQGALRPQKPLRLIRDGEFGGSGILYLTPTGYTVTTRMTLPSGGQLYCLSRFNVSLIVWTKSQDSNHKPQVLKRKESRSGSNRCPSAYQLSVLPLGHTGSPLKKHRGYLYIPGGRGRPGTEGAL